MNKEQLINLLNFDRTLMSDYLLQLNEKPCHTDRILQWIHYYGYQNFDQLPKISQSLRQHLHKYTCIEPPKMILEKQAKDGTLKWLFQLEDNNGIETVFIPESKRGTLCISSQVGCPLHCHFCSTGQQGFKRNLTASEIVGQVWFAVRALSQKDKQHDHHVTNIVLMGMGEPLLNLENVITATNIMMDDFAYGLSKYRVTISTSGITPEIDQLSQLSEVSLALSLHAPNDELRNRLMPINKQYPLKELLEACKRFFNKNPRRKVSFEYIMLKNINDSSEHAHQLAQLLQDIPCKVNLIPYNVTYESNYECSTPETIETFQSILLTKGLRTITRKKRGEDIDAACGQLAGKLK